MSTCNHGLSVTACAGCVARIDELEMQLAFTRERLAEAEAAFERLQADLKAVVEAQTERDLAHFRDTDTRD